MLNWKQNPLLVLKGNGQKNDNTNNIYYRH